VATNDLPAKKTAVALRIDLSDPKQRERVSAFVQIQRALLPDESDFLNRLFPSIVEGHHDLVWNRLRRRGLQAHEAEDLLQNCFFSLLRQVRRQGFKHPLPIWLAKITKGEISNYLRTRASSPELVPLPPSNAEEASAPDMEHVLDLRHLAWELFPRLPMHLQDVVMTVTLHGMTPEEASKVLKIPLGTVKSRLEAAKRALLALAEEFFTLSQRQMFMLGQKK
jgi:RNA polymerase sigma-70 factor (ECF subfamily)